MVHLENLIRRNTSSAPKPSVPASTSQHDGGGVPRVVRASFGHELGYLVDMSFFPRGSFTEPELALVDYSDRVTKEVHEGEGQSRNMGGAYDEHTKDMLRLYFEILESVAESYSVNVSPDFRFVISINQHDVLEDGRSIKELRGRFRGARKRASSRQGVDETKEMESIRELIRAERGKLVERLYQAQTSFIDRYMSIDGADDDEKRKLTLDGAVAFGVMDWLTRHTEQIYFHESVYHLFRRHKRNKYSNGGRGGPFQEHLMGLLGVPEDGLEPTDYFLMRVFAKVLDRVALSRERKRRFTDAQAEELEGLLQQNGWLRAIYGEGIDFRGEGFPRAYNLNILYRNFIVLQNINLALGSYGPLVVKEREENPVAYAYLLGILEARGYLMVVSHDIISELKESYGKSIRGDYADFLHKKVEDMESTNPRELEEITGEGPISRGFRLDTIYRDRWHELDGAELERVDSYRDILILEKLLRRFSDPERNRIYPSKGVFELFTIRGLTDTLTPRLEPTHRGY